MANQAVANDRIIGTPLLGRALDAWKASGLTPAQTRTELERFAADMERDRANLIAALRGIVDCARARNVKLDKAAECDAIASAVLRAIGEIE